MPSMIHVFKWQFIYCRVTGLVKLVFSAIPKACLYYKRPYWLYDYSDDFYIIRKKMFSSGSKVSNYIDS